MFNVHRPTSLTRRTRKHLSETVNVEDIRRRAIYVHGIEVILSRTDLERSVETRHRSHQAAELAYFARGAGAMFDGRRRRAAVNEVEPVQSTLGIIVRYRINPVEQLGPLARR